MKKLQLYYDKPNSDLPSTYRFWKTIFDIYRKIKDWYLRKKIKRK